MKKILFYLLLFGGITSMSGQGINDPFFNTGQARYLNNQIIAPPQIVPTLVNDAMSNMRTSTSQNIVRLAHLKNEYGFAVWDMAVTFTAHGKETALIPMVRSTGNSISGILVAVLDGTSFRYGTMDLDNPFPYASAPLNSPGMPDIRDVLAQFVIFNHTLFGTVDCNLIQALATTTTGSIRDEDESSVKSCYYQVTYAGQNCHHIYGTYPDGTQQYLYSDCVSVFNYTLVCSDTDAADTSDSESGGGGGSGGSGGTGPGDADTENQVIHKCSETVTLLALSGVYLSDRTCSLQLRLSGCNFDGCNVFFEGGALACGMSINWEGGGFSFPIGVRYEIRNLFCTSYLNTSFYYSQISGYRQCGSAYVSFELLWSTFGITESWGVFNQSFSEICYTCKEC